MRPHNILALAVLLPLALWAGCDAAQGDQAGMESTARAAGGQPEAAQTAAASSADVVVYKSPTCGCCSGWITHLESNGFDAEGVDVPEHSALIRKKAEYGVPEDLTACHTARVDGYTIEGHVPAEVVARLLRERPEGVVGLAVAGMPVGSPGMEGPNPEPYQVIAFDGEGNRSVYATIDPR